MTAPLTYEAGNAARTVGNMSNTQQRNTEWHREYREKNPTARQRKREASKRWRARKTLDEQLATAMALLKLVPNPDKFLTMFIDSLEHQQQSEVADGTSD